MGRNTVQRLEGRKQANPRMTTLVKVSLALGLPADELSGVYSAAYAEGIRSGLE